VENFIVSALKYRPATFDSVVGQSSITTTLKNAIKNNHLAHAYLFNGPRGVGKTTCARIFAKTINCNNLTESMEACNSCESCISYNQSRSYNIHELDAASNNSTDDIKNLNDQVRIPPQVGKYSVYIIDEIHMLSTFAFNAFLKTLEEPPPYAIFILATTEKYKIIPTILSRCQIYNFNRIRLDDIVGYLEYVARCENIEADQEGLNIIAQKADGALRDALSIFDQIVSFAGNKFNYNNVIENLNVLDYDYFFRITDAVIKSDYHASLLIFNDVLDKGFDGHQFLNGISKHLRDLLVCKDPATIGLLETSASIRDRYSQQALQCNTGILLNGLEICNQFDINYKTSNNARLHVELALLQLCSIEIKKKTESVNLNNSTAKPGIINSGNVQGETQNSSPAKEKAYAKTDTKPVSKIIIPSIKDALNENIQRTETVPEKNIQVSEVSTKYPGGNENREISQPELVEVWLKFASGIDESQHLISEILNAVTPVLKDNSQVVVKVEDEIQNVAIHEVEDKLLDYLRKELKDDSMQIVITREDLKEKGKELFTDNDKFNYMADKNPVLLKLKQQFNLDFE